MKGCTGTSMNGNIEYVRKKVNGIPCDCSRCKRNNKRHGVEHCEYYDILSPHRKKCARYMGPRLNTSYGNGVKKRKPKKQEIKNLQKKVGHTDFPWEYK